MHTNEWITLTRQCNAHLIPSGTPVTLREGEYVMVMQSLGGTYTVNVSGNLARIDGRDADALGFEPEVPDENEAPPKVDFNGDVVVDEETVIETLKTCFDPEIPVNIYDLGLIYNIDINEQDKGKYNLVITMTLTAPGCGMGPIIVDDLRKRLLMLAGVAEVTVDLVFEPLWEQSMMTEAAQLQLGLL